MNQVLFVCTGNFYRSRYAEALFNHEAERRELPWRAFSRGLAIHWAEGDLSPYTREALARRKIPLHYTGKTRVSLTLEDLERASLVVVLDHREHRPFVQEQFPDWVDRVTFWECGDVHLEASQVCMPKIEKEVERLLDRLEKEQMRGDASACEGAKA